ncbi:hypothetical protein PspLS_11223 [Pyricularia sp. CBS 133598]|nr:hypothetical protein PspLS_11223 [Pyricularia sp. CBS 133598]
MVTPRNRVGKRTSTRPQLQLQWVYKPLYLFENGELPNRDEQNLPEGMAVLPRAQLPELPEGSNVGFGKDMVLLEGATTSMLEKLREISQGDRGHKISLLYVEHGKARNLQQLEADRVFNTPNANGQHQDKLL